MSPSPVVPDLSGLTAQVKRVADALYVTQFGPATVEKSITELASEANAHVASVIGTDVTGANRVRTDPDVPA